MKTFISSISNKSFPDSAKVSGRSIRDSIFNLIKKDYPEFNENSYISDSELNVYRKKYIEVFLKGQLGKLTDSEKEVMESLQNRSILADKLDEEGPKPTFGQRVADKVAEFGGSWTFIIIFIVFLAVWMIINVVILVNRAFDPYPFILLNLILSTIAAIQAPVIMMSQNRQEDKDRDRAKKDYMINLKSETEIRMLQENVDHIIDLQQEDDTEIHKIQIEILNEILKKLDNLEKK